MSTESLSAALSSAPSTPGAGGPPNTPSTTAARAGTMTTTTSPSSTTTVTTTTKTVSPASSTSSSLNLRDRERLSDSKAPSIRGQPGKDGTPLGGGQSKGLSRGGSQHAPLTRQLSKDDDSVPGTPRPVHRPHGRDSLRHVHDRDIPGNRGSRREPLHGSSGDLHHRDQDRHRDRDRYPRRDRPGDRDRSVSGDRYGPRQAGDRANYAGRGKLPGPEHEPDGRKYPEPDQYRDRRERYPENDRYPPRYHEGDGPGRGFPPEERFYSDDQERGRHYHKEPVSRTASGRSLDRQRRMYDDPQQEFLQDVYSDSSSVVGKRDSINRIEGMEPPSGPSEIEPHIERRPRDRDRRDHITHTVPSNVREKERIPSDFGPPPVQYGMHRSSNYGNSAGKRGNHGHRHTNAGEDIPDARTRDLYGVRTDVTPKQHLDPSSAAGKVSAKDSRKTDSMIRNDSLSSDQSECVRPPPPKPHKGKGMRKRRDYSLSSSEEEIRSTPDYTSCDEGEIESGSISERGSGELDITSSPATAGSNNHPGLASGHGVKSSPTGAPAPSSSSHHIRHHSESEINLVSSPKKIVHFGRGEAGHSLEEDDRQIKDSGIDTCSSTTLNEEHNLGAKYPVNWQPDMENNVLIGQMVLRKNQSEACTHQDSSAILGLKVIGGKMKEAGRLGAFISKVKRGSIADTVGHLRAGDEVLSWNGHNLQGKDLNEVYNIIFESKSEPQVELVVARPMGSEIPPSSRDKIAQFQSPRPDSIMKRSSQSELQCSSGYESNKPKEEEEPMPIVSRVKRPSVTITSPGSPGLPRRNTSPTALGEIQIKLWYDSNNYLINMTVLTMHGAQPRDTGDLRNPYVKVFLLPDRSEETKRRTKTIQNTLSPKWNQTFTFGPIKRSEFRGRDLEVTVWDFEQYGAKEFLGQMILPLEGAPFDGQSHWYSLYPHGSSRNQPSSPPQQPPPQPKKQLPLTTNNNGNPGMHDIIGKRMAQENGNMREQLSPSSVGRITDSDVSDFDDGLTGLSVTPPTQEDLTPNEEPMPSKQRRNSQSTLAVPERVSRRPRSPSPIRKERGRTRHSEPAIEYGRQHRAQDLQQEMERDRDQDRDRDRDQPLDRDRERDRNHTRERGRERDRDRDLDRELDRERERDMYSYRGTEVDDIRTSPNSTSSRGHERESPHRLDRSSPPRREREHRSRTLSPPNMYEYDEPRRSRSPSRRSVDTSQSDSYQRRSRSENRGEMEYDRQYRGRHMLPPPTSGLDSSSLPNSPIHAGRNSPSSTPSTPRKQQRRLPQIPPSSKADKGTADIEERARQIKLKMSQYKQAASANTLSPHGSGGGIGGGGGGSLERGSHMGSPGHDMSLPFQHSSHRRKQSPDNISIKSSDSNLSSTSDVSAVTAASTASAFSTQSERPRPTRKFSTLSLNSSGRNRSAKHIHSASRKKRSLSESQVKRSPRSGERGLFVRLMRRKLGRHREERLEDVGHQVKVQRSEQVFRGESGHVQGESGRVQKAEPRMVAIQMLYYSDGSDNEDEYI
ncbi:regulating synaptic membrane exocytosis protein 2-like isoform X6 [Lytechinus pictus]|uniref:regulating synaptic membrane exocytosis protein 2-like isoform X6 n=1 Tax=Lytechinus pictus TaxID=7653 RepID=UPI0030B9BF56